MAENGARRGAEAAVIEGTVGYPVGTMEVRNRKVEQGEATRTVLLDTARTLFTDKGFADTPTEEIVARAGVTRGALYHHFESKEDLFRVLVEQIEADVTTRVAEAAMSKSDCWQGILAGVDTYLDACMDPSVQRILLIDAPSVLGIEGWREIEDRYGLAVTQAALQIAIDQGRVRKQPTEPIARVVLGAVYEGSLHIARAEDKVAARKQIGTTLRSMLGGLLLDKAPSRATVRTRR